jgi:ectoine hydroxylase-related dioxygenase (phytanoyl-CoA dioxygenase family)
MTASSFLLDGFAVVPDVLGQAECDALCASALALSSESPGMRSLLAHGWCRSLTARLRAHPAIAAAIPDDFVAVQCTYFEKSREQNWLVPVHQDLSIPVKARVEHPELRGWSEKQGGVFVQPPVAVLEQLVAVRVHLDPCGEEDGPLQFVPTTHRLGRIAAARASVLKQAGPLVTCALGRGGVLIMRPLALHASSKATGSSRRRVLHFVFGPRELPYGLQWEQAVSLNEPG